jgi:integrase
MSNQVPIYRCKKVRGYKYGCVSLPDGTGGRRDVLLGRHGTKQSKSEYARVIAEWQAQGRSLPDENPSTGVPDISVSELLAAYWRHAESYYRDKNGEPTGEIHDLRLALRPLKEMFGELDASKFTPKALKAVRQQMVTKPIVARIKVTDPKTGKRAWTEKLLRVGLCRKLINARIHRIRRVFRWGVSEGLIDANVYVALQTVEALKAGRSAARESQPVKAVSEALVLDTLPFLSVVIGDMVRVLMLTGMRCGELCGMKACNLDTTGAVWLFRPDRHKTEHHGHERVIAIGPRAQQIIKKYLKPNVEAYLFSPAESVRAFRAKQRQERKTRVQPSQVCRKKAKPKRRPGDRYNAKAISHAIGRACQKHGLAPWHAHQLRHSVGTAIRRELGIDEARAVLGHSSANTTGIYAELDQGKAVEVARKLG